MALRAALSLLVASSSVQLMLAAPVLADEGLDLSFEPDEVARPREPVPLDLRDEQPLWDEPGLGAPGWSMRPEVELDVEASEDADGGGLPSLDPELESLGLRLKRTW